MYSAHLRGKRRSTIVVMSKSGASDRTTLVAHVRPSRQKARRTAVAEILALLRDLGATASASGPLAQVRGIIWVTIPEENVATAQSRLQRLGYTCAVDIVRELPENRAEAETITKWKGRNVALVRIYKEPDNQLRESAPDRRTFLLEGADGVVRPVVGYRGSPGSLEHRALPVVDARLLVNLVWQPKGGILLDPFAGAGGVVIEAKLAGWTTVSLDNDPSLRFGLNRLADLHVVGTAAMLPFGDASVDAIATEPPYHPSVLDMVTDSIGEMFRVLRAGGRGALLVAADQAQQVRCTLARLDVALELDEPIDRKGTAVHCFCCKR